MDRSVEAWKQVNLVDFLSQHYGLKLSPQGGAFACRSPFTAERNPSFFVRLVNGHWLFKDFSSGAGGTIFDFVEMKEKLGSFGDAVRFLRGLIGPRSSPLAIAGGVEEGPGTRGDASDQARNYDIDGLYQHFRNEDPEVCRKYLLGRGIDPALVESLIEEGTVVHNRHGGRSWCCFAVRDDAGSLRCLDNHAVDGRGKFVLGSKIPFSREWEEVKRSKVVFLCEGIIDYLSVKTIERDPPPGLALLGNQLCFEASLLEGAEVLVSAMDADHGGNSAVLDLQARYREKEVRIYDLEGHKDPNELLLAIRSGAGRRLSPERKLQLYREFHESENKAELARRWGLDRSYLYELVRDCEQSLREALASRKPGRPPKGQPATLAEAVERIKELEAACEREATRREEFYCRSELLAIRLKYAEIEAAEARGEKIDEDQPELKKTHVKKKRNRKP